MKDNGRVSIIMPSYNTGEFLTKSIESVLQQTYKNWELIIVDDCSNDETDSVIAQFKNDQRIKFLKNKKNMGAAFSRNLALRNAKGRWIAFLDSDDLWLPQKLELQIGFMVNNDYKFSYTNYREINENGDELNIHITGPRIITRNKMITYCWPGCLTVMYEREAVGLLQINDIKKNNDYLMWLHIIEMYKCYNLNIELSLYRIRKNSISNQKYIKLIKWHYKLFKEGLEMNPIKSFVHTVINMIGGVYKKLVFVKREKEK